MANWGTMCLLNMWHIRPKTTLLFTGFFFVLVVFAEGGELRRTLQSLACGKARVLMKKPKVRNTRWLSLSFMHPEGLEWVLEGQLSVHFSANSYLYVKQFQPRFLIQQFFFSVKTRFMLSLSCQWTVLSPILSCQLKLFQPSTQTRALSQQ